MSDGAMRDGERTSQPPDRATEKPPSELRILIVDDDPDMATLLASNLRRAGMRVARAGDGIAAMELARLHQPDVALIDIGLPHLDGHRLGKELRSRAKGRGLGLVAITGDGRDATRRTSLAAGFDAHLVKPADLSALPGLIRDLGTHAQSGHATEGREIRALVVDDDRDFSELLALTLGRRGMEVTVAHEEVTAIEEARRHRLDIVLVDVGLPDVDGHRLGQELRGLREGAQLALVAFTGDGRPSARRRSREAGFDAHIVKPLELRALVRLVRELTAAVRRPGSSRGG